MIGVDDIALVMRAKAGDSEAFGQLVSRHAESVKAYCYYRTSSFEDSRDLCQETFVLAYVKLHQLREDSKFPAWIKKIAHSCCSRWTRSRREIATEEIELHAAASEPKDVEMVRDALLALPDTERLAVVLHYVDGLSYEEMADFLEISESAVRGRLYRGRKMLKKEMVDMTREVFEQQKLGKDFVIRTLDLTSSYTRRGMGWSPDGKHIMFLRRMDDGSQLWITNTEGADAQPVSKIGWPDFYSWSPDSKKLVYSYTPARDAELESSFNVFDVETGENRALDSGFKWRLLDGTVGTPIGWCMLSWSPDCRSFAVLMGRKDREYCVDTVIYNIETGAQKRLTPDLFNTGHMYAGDWFPDGSHFALLGFDDDKSFGRIRVYDRSGENVQFLTDADWNVVSDPRIRPGTGEIAFSTTHGRPNDEHPNRRCDLWIMQPDGSNKRCLASGHSDDPYKRVSFLNPDWTSDGKYIVSLSVKVDAGNHDCQGIYLIDGDTGETIKVLESDPQSDKHLIGFRNKISICANGKAIAFTVAEYTVDDRSKKVPSYTNRKDILYYYDIPTKTLHELLRTSPEEDGELIYQSGYNWMPLCSPDGTRILFTRGTTIDQSKWKEPVGPEGRLPYGLGSVWDYSQPHSVSRTCFLELK